MKYAFSTLGCPAWSIEQVVDAALRMGYDGIELRLLDGQIIEPTTDREKVSRAVAICRAHGLEVCALDTSCSFNFSSSAERLRQIASLRSWMQLAQKVQVPRLRVFGGGHPAVAPAPTAAEENGRIVESLRRVVGEAERASVTIMLETHDAFSSAHRVSSVLRAVDSPSVAALWDTQHTYRAGENAEDVIATLGTRIAHVHVKDARRIPGNSNWQLVLPGEGEVPVREQLQALQRHGYAHFVSVEWEKKWHPELAEPEIALPQHIAWLKGVS
ncbi:MAG: sugar phosphate isomerase/epimerase family protein [Ktedonobacteraceae bacterium]